MATASFLDTAHDAKRLEGKVALITGGARGLGECMTRLFCKNGAKVVIADIRDQLGLALQDTIGVELATYVHCDVTKEDDVENVVNIAISKYQKLDIIVNNAAAIDDYRNPSIINNDVSEFERVLRVNLTGPFLVIKHAARVMIPEKKGSIVNVGSVSSSVGGVATHAYTSSKHGLIGLTKNAAADLGKFGIRVNCLSPYFIANDAGKEFFKLDEEGCLNVYSNLKGVHLMEEDVAQAAVYLASDESKYISGHNLAVDGGFTTINPIFGVFSQS
ncbi:secoisolariciresinol dehydrogenase-like [Arachis duranensis]|uniref:Secoisolariciresinol dehydrogenase-like n=1 Tax=Arachis duranensis TaxID=130453 RepID=A0A6P5NNW9_ARADU|nr:secoisolariciresinol dehydrogenase-like [Arachis duranensis]